MWLVPVRETFPTHRVYPSNWIQIDLDDPNRDIDTVNGGNGFVGYFKTPRLVFWYSGERVIRILGRAVGPAVELSATAGRGGGGHASGGRGHASGGGSICFSFGGLGLFFFLLY